MSSTRKPRRGRLAICRFYSSTRGCSKADKCNFLHICRAFIDGSCRSSQQCHSNHNFASPQMIKILRKHDLDPHDDEHKEYLLNLLRPKPKTTDGLESEEEERDSEEEEEDTISNASSTKPSKRNARNRQRRRKRKPSTPSEATNDTPKPSDEKRQRELCVYYVQNGHCRNGKECPQLHASRLPFQWQVCRNNSWGNLDQASNRTIETSYCDPNISRTAIKKGDQTYDVEFTTMSMVSQSSTDDSQEIRRLSTVTSVKNRNKRMDSVCTHWHWYFYLLGFYFECHTEMLPDIIAVNSDILEREYHTFKNQEDAPNPYGFFPTVSIDHISVTLGSTTLVLLRRPKLYAVEEKKSGPVKESSASVGTDLELTNPGAAAEQIETSKATHEPTEKNSLSASLSSTSASSPLQAREICSAMVRNKKCKYGEECRKFHSERSYQWQYVNSESEEWTNFSQDDNTSLEESFCEPSTDDLTYELSGNEYVDYCYEQSLKELTVSRFCIGNDIFRRLSTMSTVQCRSAWLEPFCIEWLWYWQDVNGTWIQYAEKSAKDTTSDVDGDTIERAYEDYLTGRGDKMFPFSTHENNYQLNFETMQQRNVHYTTQRCVRRRPKFQTMSDRWQLVRQQKSQDNSNKGIFPKTWVMKGMQTSSEPKLIRLNVKDEEYLTVEKMFLETMADVNILAIKRVQNMELWDDFYSKREKMKRKSKHVLEKQLWHGTKRDSSEAICRQNFDFRISGSNVGTIYGQGSYFHCNASYSNSYTALENNVRRMFLVRVLVGSYITGTSDMKRPPPKDPYKPLGDLHDACVDNDSDPSIFVIFETRQVYPEYLVEYNNSSGAVASIAPRAATPSVPKATSRQASSRSVNTHTTTPSHSLSRPGSTAYSSNSRSANVLTTPQSSSFSRSGSARAPSTAHSNHLSSHSRPSSVRSSIRATSNNYNTTSSYASRHQSAASTRPTGYTTSSAQYDSDSDDGYVQPQYIDRYDDYDTYTPPSRSSASTSSSSKCIIQ